jgi:hypothetical protein
MLHTTVTNGMILALQAITLAVVGMIYLESKSDNQFLCFVIATLLAIGATAYFVLFSSGHFL